jgi:hypothetical protein
MIRRVPVARRHDRKSQSPEHGDIAVERRHDLVAARHGEAAPGQEIQLDIDEDQRIARPGPDHFIRHAAYSLVFLTAPRFLPAAA